MPKLRFYRHTRAVDIQKSWLRSRALAALPLCLRHPGPHAPVLPHLSEIEITLIGDEDMSRIHAEFLNDPSPTDVMTFPHGEILIGAEFAIGQAAAHGLETQHEILLYLIHGLLHLNGHEDHVPEEAEAMKQVQEHILAEVISGETR